MKRREFLLTAGGAAGAATAAASAGSAAAQEGGTETATGGNATATPSGNATATGTPGGGGGGTTKEVAVGPGGSLVFEPEKVYVKPGDTVKWVWESDNHNVVPGEIPGDATWEGTAGPPSKTYNTGHTYSHTFEVKGKYHYWCQPHKTAGMVGDVIVNDTGQPPGASGGGGGGGEVDPEHMGVPIQAHFVGIGAVVATLVSLVFTFFVLKYGESPHASGGN